MKFERAEVLTVCSKYGPLLQVDPDLDGPTVMAAIASNESSVGVDNGPRHEPSYDVGGSYYNGDKEQRDLIAQFGSDAACSYGPWQLMFINCPGYTPAELQTDLESNAKAFLAHFNRYVVATRHAKTLSEIGQVWNGGHIFTGTVLPGVAAYVQKLSSAYAEFKGMMTP